MVDFQVMEVMNVMGRSSAVCRLRRLVFAAVALAATAVAIGPSARAQDDPFADELNPFGTGASKSPAAKEPIAVPPAPPRAPAKPQPKLPVPFPETAVPGWPAERRERMPVPFARERDRDSGNGSLEPRRRDQRFGFDESEDEQQWEPTETEKKLATAEKLEQQGKLAEARDLLLDVVKLDPSLPMGHLALGVVLRRLGDFRGSVEACSKGIQIDSKEPELYLRRGIAWFHLGLYGIALEDFEEAAGIAYDDPRPELWRGLTLIELSRQLEAINAYASSIRRDRTYMLAYLNRGLAYLATNEPGKAEFDFNLAIRQQPKDARAWSNRGVAQARQGRYREAIESYETALGISPNDQPTRRNLEAARRLATSTATPPSR